MLKKVFGWLLVVSIVASCGGLSFVGCWTATQEASREAEAERARLYRVEVWDAGGHQRTYHSRGKVHTAEHWNTTRYWFDDAETGQTIYVSGGASTTVQAIPE